jgi:hypothetical protein
LENPFEELAVAPAAPLHFDLVNTPGGPCVHRRIDVAEGPFVGRQSIFIQTEPSTR